LSHTVIQLRKGKKASNPVYDAMISGDSPFGVLLESDGSDPIPIRFRSETVQIRGEGNESAAFHFAVLFIFFGPFDFGP
jgi:hypothetical protein